MARLGVAYRLLSGFFILIWPLIAPFFAKGKNKGVLQRTEDPLFRLSATKIALKIRRKQQFVWNDFCEDYQTTERKHTYYPSVITNERLYEIKISDLPVIPYFPVNSYYEWTDFRFYGLRSATAYVLVFDLSSLETFQYVRTLREQICESRNMSNVPVLVIGNKQDLISTSEDQPAMSSSKAITSGAEEKRKDIVNLVKKHWKCGYVECSAKYNWKVVAAFKELINMIDSIEIREQSPILDNLQDALDRNKCVIL